MARPSHPRRHSAAPAVLPSNRSTTPAAHPSGRSAAPRRAFGDPVAAPVATPAYEAPPLTNRVNLLLPLHVVMPDQWIMDAGKIVFHTVGDTGGVNDGAAQQTLIAHAMQAQVEAVADSAKPAFFYNLGDVVYFNGQSSDYSWQFYEPYQFYQPYIFAIAGNHDGDIRTRRNDPPVIEPTLTGFMSNFCDDSPREIQPYHRDTMTQPYVYWTLDAPFVTIIGLYSNIDGDLDGRGGFEQKPLAARPADRRRETGQVLGGSGSPSTLLSGPAARRFARYPIGPGPRRRRYGQGAGRCVLRPRPQLPTVHASRQRPRPTLRRRRGGRLCSLPEGDAQAANQPGQR